MKFEIQFNSIQIIEVEISSNYNHIDITIFDNELILVHKFANKQISDMEADIGGVTFLEDFDEKICGENFNFNYLNENVKRKLKKLNSILIN